MRIKNPTPFPAVAWETVDARKSWRLTLLLRIRYRFQPGLPGEWTLRLTPDQGEWFTRDIYYHAAPDSPVRYESDFIPGKPAADVIINALARTATPKHRWHCGVLLTAPDGGILAHPRIEVSSERWHRKAGREWQTDEPRKVNRVPVRYDRAYGGTLFHPDADRPVLAEHPANPAGTGLTHPEMAGNPWLEPQLQWLDRGRAPEDTPPGFGIIPRTWAARLALAGTYDDDWLEQQHPYPPHDFDPRHYQAANPALILEDYLPPGTRFELSNLMGEDRVDRFQIPELPVVADIRTGHETNRYSLPIDTVLVDIEAGEADEWSVWISHRISLPRPDDTRLIRFLCLPQRSASPKEDSYGS